MINWLLKEVLVVIVVADRYCQVVEAPILKLQTT